MEPMNSSKNKLNSKKKLVFLTNANTTKECQKESQSRR